MNKENPFFIDYSIKETYNDINGINSINEKYYVSFDDNTGRFGNQLFTYMTCKLFTILTGHIYIPREDFPNNRENIIIINEDNINYYINNKNIIGNKNIILQGYFQNSELFINYRQKLIELIFSKNNNDYFKFINASNGSNSIHSIKEYLIESKHTINFKDNDIFLTLRLDDFILYPCKTSEIIPPHFYIDIIEHLKQEDIYKDSNLYIICDKIKYDWEYKYIEYFHKFNPILIQNTLIHDIALIRDCKNIIHSNSSLHWIISFLSNKYKRIIPHTPKENAFNNVSLKNIEKSDIIKYVTPLNHDEVHNLNVNENSVFPFSMCIPDECIAKSIPEKKFLLASLIPGDMSTYIFDKYSEKEYNDMYKESRFAITKMKGGWDCLRHYEILMNGCIPLFKNLNECPKYTLTTYPKHLNDEAYNLYNNWIENEEFINKYNILCSKYLEHTRENCTTSALTKYFLKICCNSNNSIKNILLITCHEGVNYNRELLWIGLKRYFKEIGGVGVEYNKLPFLYDDFDNYSDNIYYGNNCYTFPRRLQKDKDYNMTENEIIDKINSNFWDLIIYGKVGPDEFCTFPFYDIVKTKYNKNKIVFLFGGDEIFNLKISNPNSNHINMFNRPIYYKKYYDYLTYCKQYAKCFVRELEM